MKNYIFYYQKDILQNLLDQKKIYSSIKSSNVKAITDAWMRRWLIKRIQRAETLEKLRAILISERLKRKRQTGLNNFVRKVIF